ncbi:Lipid transfer-like protein VAS [Bienertia sinuspersici]
MEKPAMVVVMVLCMAAIATAQTSTGGIPQCATKLVPCFNYLNSTTTPPSECCNPIKEAVTKERACLCSIYNNPVLIQALHINVTQALNLVTLCHVDAVVDPSICKAEGPSPSISTGSTFTPSGTSSSSTSANAAAKITGPGLAGLVSVALAFGAYSMFY